MRKDTRKKTPTDDADSMAPRSALRSALQSWVDFWFSPIDPRGLHAIRILAGVLFIAWLLPFAGELNAMFGLDGWFDQQAYREAARLSEEARPQFGWSILFLCGTNSMLLKAAYGLSLMVLGLFTLGIATRLTSILTWIIVVSFTANPATSYDADTLLVMLAFYLMIGYVFLGQQRSGQSLCSRWMGCRENWVFFGGTSGTATAPRTPSAAANVALRLLQVHLAIVMLTSGLHKLQFGDWWAGVALWYPLYPPLVATVADAREHMASAVPFLFILSVAAYVTLSWQIAFPAFAWKPAWRKILLVGAIVSWLGNMFLYELPLFGAVIFIGCLSYLAPAEWERVYERLGKLRGLVVARQK